MSATVLADPVWIYATESTTVNPCLGCREQSITFKRLTAVSVNDILYIYGGFISYYYEFVINMVVMIKSVVTSLKLMYNEVTFGTYLNSAKNISHIEMQFKYD